MKYRYCKWHAFETDKNEALEENISIWESFVLRVPALGLIPFNISIPGWTEVWQILKTIYWADNLLSFSPGDIPYRALSWSQTTINIHPALSIHGAGTGCFACLTSLKSHNPMRNLFLVPLYRWERDGPELVIIWPGRTAGWWRSE